MQDKFSFNNFSSFTVNGKTRKISELEEYLTDLHEKGITIDTKLNIGDIVKLKNRPDEYIVEYIDYEIKGIGIVDYLGRKVNEKQTTRLSFFNQHEIEAIVKRAKENKKEEEEER